MLLSIFTTSSALTSVVTLEGTFYDLVHNTSLVHYIIITSATAISHYCNEKL